MTFRRRISVTVVILILCSCAVREGTTRSEQSAYRNVLFIAVDDLKPILGAYDDEAVISPNIDALAEAGIVFLNNHSQQAVCAPSRASLLTGLRPDRTQVWDLRTLMRDRNPDIITMPQHFKNHGYNTAAVGKIFDFRSVDAGGDSISWTVPFVEVGLSRWINGEDQKLSTEAPEVDDRELQDGWIVDRGIALMNSLAREDAPFFLAVGFKKPHLPFVAPKKYWDLYDRDDFQINDLQTYPEGAPEYAPQPGHELRNGYGDVDKDGPIPVDKQLELIHGYYACVSFIDAKVGELMAELDKLGIRDETAIVLWGDHGWHLGDHGMWCKHTNYEQATRSPMIFAAPAGQQGGRTSVPTEFVDVFPTLCELTGVPTPDKLDGVSLLPLFTDPETEVKPFAMSQYHRKAPDGNVEGYALRNDRYRYVEWLPRSIRNHGNYDPTTVVDRELYDYHVDPSESRNLVTDPAYSEVITALQKQMESYFEPQAN